jgi:hypothetical protein
MRRKFLIPTLVAAGLVHSDDAVADIGKAAASSFIPKDKNVFRRFSLDHRYTLAGHSSHSSHSSHASHASHRSSVSGGYVSPTPLYTPPVVDPVPAPVPQPLVTLPGNSDKFKKIVMYVQLALLDYGYFNGKVDGVFSPEMRLALTKLQTDYGLKVTGTITPQVLDSLHILAE